MIKAIIFLGPPASGKGTQAQIIADKIGAYYFRASKIIQNKFASASDDPNVIAAKEHHDRGELVPPEILVKWTAPEIEKLLKQNIRIVFDGAFRTLYEAQYTFPILEKYLKLSEIKVFFLKISEKTAVARSASRRTCQVCGFAVPQSYLRKNCPRCGGKLIRRVDEKTIERRLEIYNKETLPVLAFFKEKGILEEIDAEPAIEEISEEIIKRL